MLWKIIHTKIFEISLFSDPVKKPIATPVEDKENSDSEKENSQIDENSPQSEEGLSTNKLEEAAQQFNNSRYKVQYEDDESDSDEDVNDEEETARNKLKALLGGNRKRQQSPPSPPQMRKSHSADEPAEENFLNVIQSLKNDLYNKLEIPVPEEEDEDMEVSKIFYEGREGQEYTVKVLERFFSKLSHQAEQFTQQNFREEERQKAEEQQQVAINDNQCRRGTTMRRTKAIRTR